jgi:hypothetical protein
MAQFGVVPPHLPAATKQYESALCTPSLPGKAAMSQCSIFVGVVFSGPSRKLNTHTHTCTPLAVLLNWELPSRKRLNRVQSLVG